jgi:hypothetical protein
VGLLLLLLLLLQRIWIVGLLLLLLLLGWFPPREDGKGALNVVVVSGTFAQRELKLLQINRLTRSCSIQKLLRRRKILERK